MKRRVGSARTIHEEGYGFTAPGELTHATCRVCGERCHIDRDVMGPTGFAQAIARRASRHDRVVCPHGGEPWHNRAVRLRREVVRTPSRRLAAMMQEELDELLGEGRNVPP